VPIQFKFPYHYKTINFGQIPDPCVDLKVETAGSWQLVRFLVDSGADTIALPSLLVEIWGIEFDRTKRTTMGGVEDERVKAILLKSKLNLVMEN
jgi:hypothetical protein